MKGPIGVDGPDGERWYQTFTEVRTRWRNIKFFTLRSGAFGSVKEHFTVDCARKGIRVLRYHTDGAPELISSEIVKMLAELGCRVTFSAPYTPEQNNWLRSRTELFGNQQ